MWAWLGFATLAGVGLYLYRADERLRWVLAAGLAFGLAGARYQLAQPNLTDPTFIATYNNIGEVTIEGIVWEEPDVRDTRTNLRIQVDTLLLPDAQTPLAVQGLALAYAPRFDDARLTATSEGEWRYGDRVRVFGLLEAPPEFEDFSYRDYLARQSVYSQLRRAQITFLKPEQGSPFWNALFKFKHRSLTVLTQILPEPHAALLAGILLGVEANIPTDLKDAFSTTGTSHIVAISGFNIAIIAGIFSSIANRLFGTQRGAIVAILAIAIYTLLVGASASVVRAAIMGSLALIAQRLGRRAFGLNTLSAAVIAMTLWNPFTVWDVGFQLSVAATLGLVLYADPLNASLIRALEKFLSHEKAQRLADWLGESFTLTLAAQLTTLPIIIYYFKRLSLISLLANFVILPAQPAVMIVGGLALLAGLFNLMVGQWLAWVVWPFTAYTIAFVQFFAQLPAASIGLSEVTPWVVLALYALLIWITWRAAQPSTALWDLPHNRWLNLSVLSVLALGGVLLWGWYFSLPSAPNLLKIVVLDVGQGEAILIETPSGARALINGGPSGGALTRSLAQHLPLFSNELGLLVIAAPRDQNLGGLPDLFTRYTVSQTVLTAAPGKSATYQTVREQLTHQKLSPLTAAELPAFDLGDDTQLKIIYDGEQGSVVRVTRGKFSLLLPIGLKAEEEAHLIAVGLAESATALLIANSGAANATSADWLATINPRVVLLSAQAGHPDTASEVLQRIQGRTLLRTDEHGYLMLSTDGENLWIETER